MALGVSLSVTECGDPVLLCSLHTDIIDILLNCRMHQSCIQNPSISTIIQAGCSFQYWTTCSEMESSCVSIHRKAYWLHNEEQQVHSDVYYLLQQWLSLKPLWYDRQPLDVDRDWQLFWKLDPVISSHLMDYLTISDNWISDSHLTMTIGLTGY